MNINAISTYNAMPLPQVKTAEVTDQPKTGFAAIFDAYMGLVDQTSALNAEADALQVDFALGKTDDFVTLSLLQEKALASVNFTVQVTNKLLSAYQEIMRISM